MNAVDKINYSMPEIPEKTGAITFTNTPTASSSSVKQYGNICVVRIQAYWQTEQTGVIGVVSGIPLPSVSIQSVGVTDGEAGIGTLFLNGSFTAGKADGTATDAVDFTFVYMA